MPRGHMGSAAMIPFTYSQPSAGQRMDPSCPGEIDHFCLTIQPASFLSPPSLVLTQRWPQIADFLSLEANDMSEHLMLQAIRQTRLAEKYVCLWYLSQVLTHTHTHTFCNQLANQIIAASPVLLSLGGLQQAKQHDKGLHPL